MIVFKLRSQNYSVVGTKQLKIIIFKEPEVMKRILMLCVVPKEERSKRRRADCIKRRQAPAIR